VQLFGFHLDAITMTEAVAQIFAWARGDDNSCHLVVTPNADHAVMYQQRRDLRRAYRHASLVLADGMPILLAGRLLRRALPCRVTGSDLAPALFAATEQFGPLSIFLLGAAPGVADRAALHITNTWPLVTVVGTYSPPLGFEHDRRETEHVLRLIAEARPDVLVVGLGAPKQELWVDAHRTQLEARVALCIGATIDFLAGEKRRAPRWMRRIGLEWLHRLATEPRRLLKRYLRDAWFFPGLVVRQWLADRRDRR
jgi:N-acetylglucosaminyldiphosphoundecaprenol N-acetyl-beta-D-mannosaminyltransferase